MKTVERLNALMELAEDKYDNGDPGHDIAHIRRVVKSCIWLGEQEGADLNVLIPAAILHDVVNVPKDSPDRINASQMAADEAEVLLRAVGYKGSEVEAITQAIVEHSFSLGKKPSTKESAILQDADKLDGLGAIGVMRATTCGTKLGSKYYHPEEPIPQNRELDDKAYTIDHYFVKLFKLPELMNTEAAKDEAQRRVSFMKNFLDQLNNEVGLNQNH